MSEPSRRNGILFRNAKIFDGSSAKLQVGLEVLVVGEQIQTIGPVGSVLAEDVKIIDCAGGTLMPGIIDAHVHVYGASLNVTRLVQSPMSYVAHYAACFMQASLNRGFTTLRDMGGADVGLALAIKDGLLQAVPRLFYGGRVISQTGGHGDFRTNDHNLNDHQYCGCGGHVDILATVADGVDAVRKAVREELRRGASHIKVMASGGVASQSGRLDRCQYSEEELRSAVDEAERAGSYVATHCHPTEAVRRSAALGVRSIEHATFIDRPTADFVAERGSYVVPTMAIVGGLVEKGAELGVSSISMEKLKRVAEQATRSIQIMKEAGIRMGFGSDLLGALSPRQATEFILRAEVLPAIDILRSACSVNAEIMGQSGRLGCVKEGAAADLLVVNGDPLEDISLLGRDGAALNVIMAAGRLHKTFGVTVTESSRML
jgi:imidazolonepropionase-like amidohydrolase